MGAFFFIFYKKSLDSMLLIIYILSIKLRI